eukprot:SAG31_NODE_4812_length_2942_cov_1.217024_4_plen_60_part_00
MTIGTIVRRSDGRQIMSPQIDPILKSKEPVWCFCLDGQLEGLMDESDSGCYFNAVSPLT